MPIATVFAYVACTDLAVSARWYEKLFGQPPVKRADAPAVEWQFSDSAEVRLCERPADAGHTNLTLGVLPIEPERRRLVEAGLVPGDIEETDGYFVMRLQDPDGNELVFASARRT